MSGGRDAFVEGVLHGKDRRVRATLLRALLTLLSYGHRTVLETYLLPFRIGLRRRHRLRDAHGRPVQTICIGNLSSGGTGKTPMAQLVAGHLHQTGRRVALLSRGHGGSGEAGHAPRIVSDGTRTLIGPDDAGDEPTLLAESLPGVPVVVGRDRRRSGRLAVETFAPNVVVLDDALQYWQLERDLDIVLLDARRPFDNGYLLPRGLLREPPAHLARAGIIVLTRADRVTPAEREALLARVAALAPGASVFTATHAPVGWVRASDRALLPLNALAGRSARLFSGIADNQAFRESVESLGVQITDARFFGDHFGYTATDLAAFDTSGLTVTTEKDLVKVAALWPGPLGDLYALRIDMRVEDEARLFALVEGVQGDPLAGADPVS